MVEHVPTSKIEQNPSKKIEQSMFSPWYSCVGSGWCTALSGKLKWQKNIQSISRLLRERPHPGHSGPALGKMPDGPKLLEPLGKV